MPLSLLTRHRIASTVASIIEMRTSIDPLLGTEFSILHSRLGAALKRDGNILCDVLTETLQASQFLSVWPRQQLFVSPEADLLASAGIEACQNIHLPYRPGIGRSVCPDIITLDHRSGRVAAYEVKRGAGTSDAGKKRSMIRDLLSIRMQLCDWVRMEGFRPTDAVAKLLFVYGTRQLHRIDPRLALYRDEFDQHFQLNVDAELEEARQVFRQTLLEGRGQFLLHAA